MIPQNYVYSPYYPPNYMSGMPGQMAPAPLPPGAEQYLIAGITPSTTSAGGFGAYSAGAEREPVFGTNLSPQQAAQLFGQQISPDTGSPFPQAPGSPTRLGIEYIQGYLRTQIGQPVRVEFLLGTDSLVDRRGQLLEVGVDYISIREQETDDIVQCDIFSIIFVTIYK